MVGLFTPHCPCGFWICSCGNFGDIVLKFCIHGQLSSPNKSANFKTMAGKTKISSIKLLLKFMDLGPILKSRVLKTRIFKI